MSRIIAQAFVWNSAQFIAAPILALEKYVDEIRVFDGAYVQMRDHGYAKVPYSTDGTADIIKALKVSCPLTWYPAKDFFPNEVAKKTYMLQFWHPGEWMYLMADDEVPCKDIRAAMERVRQEKTALVATIPCMELYTWKEYKDWWMPGQLVSVPRVFMWQEGLHWRGKHDRFYNAQGQRRDTWPTIALQEMLILHLKFLRPIKRLQAQLDYEKLDL